MNERIREIRKSLNLTQEEFASKLSITRGALSRIESGERNPSSQTIKLICSEFGVNRHWLETGEGDMIDPASASDIQLLTQAMDGQCDAKKTILRAVASMPDDLLEKILEYLNKAGL